MSAKQRSLVERLKDKENAARAMRSVVEGYPDRRAHAQAEFDLWAKTLETIDREFVDAPTNLERFEREAEALRRKIRGLEIMRIPVLPTTRSVADKVEALRKRIRRFEKLGGTFDN